MCIGLGSSSSGRKVQVVFIFAGSLCCVGSKASRTLLKMVRTMMTFCVVHVRHSHHSDICFRFVVLSTDIFN
jgi:hypothetical protein